MFNAVAVIIICVTVTVAERQFRIVNGTKVTDATTYPYMVALHIYRTNGPRLCGGSIIRHDAVLTAAHCLEDTIGVDVLAGITNMFTDPESMQKRYGKRIVGQYSSNGIIDIAILFLWKSFTWNEFVKPINLAKSYDYWEGRAVVALGYGKDETGNETPDLRRADMELENLNKCGTSTICAIYSKSSSKWSTPCKGDSGGPLASGNILLGIARWFGGLINLPNGYTCDPKNFSYFGQVSYFKNWIISTLNENIN